MSEVTDFIERRISENLTKIGQFQKDLTEVEAKREEIINYIEEKTKEIELLKQDRKKIGEK